MMTRLFLILTFLVSICTVSHGQNKSDYASIEFGVRQVGRVLDKPKQYVDAMLANNGYKLYSKDPNTGVHFYLKSGTEFTAKYILKNGVLRLFVWNETRENARILFDEVAETSFKLDEPGDLTWTNPVNKQILMFNWKPKDRLYNIYMGYN